MSDLISDKFQWCYTNGNAAKAISKFFNNLNDIKNNLDWRSIETTDFRDDNDDGDEDRIRKKHAEFLVKDHVPIYYVKGIAVLDQTVKEQVEQKLKDLKITIEVKIKTNYYF